MITIAACNKCGKKMNVARNGIVAHVGESYFNGDAYDCPTCDTSVFVTDTQGFSNPEPIDLIISQKENTMIKKANQWDLLAVLDNSSKGVARDATGMPKIQKEVDPSKLTPYQTNQQYMKDLNWILDEFCSRNDVSKFDEKERNDLKKEISRMTGESNWEWPVSKAASLEKLVTLANQLDAKGFVVEAQMVDEIIKKEAPSPYEHRVSTVGELLGLFQGISPDTELRINVGGVGGDRYVKTVSVVRGGEGREQTTATIEVF